MKSQKRSEQKQRKSLDESEPVAETDDRSVSFYSLSGDIDVGYSSTNMVSTEPAETHDFKVDAHRRAFGRSSLFVTVGDQEQVVVLSARQVELLLKLIGVIPYVPEEDNPQHTET